MFNECCAASWIGQEQDLRPHSWASSAALPVHLPCRQPAQPQARTQRGQV